MTQPRAADDGEVRCTMPRTCPHDVETKSRTIRVYVLVSAFLGLKAVAAERYPETRRDRAGTPYFMYRLYLMAPVFWSRE